MKTGLRLTVGPCQPSVSCTKFLSYHLEQKSDQLLLCVRSSTLVRNATALRFQRLRLESCSGNDVSCSLCSCAFTMSRQLRSTVNIRLFRSNTCRGSYNMEVERTSARNSLQTRRCHCVRRWTGASAVSNAPSETEELNMPTAACPI